MSHNHAQEEELAFWLTPGAEFGEQLKQLVYAKYLKLDFFHDGSSPYVIDKKGLQIVDVGGGPVSLLLKTIAKNKIVIDPCEFPEWVEARYKSNDIYPIPIEGEYFLKDIINLGLEREIDEVWMYNVLQHTEDPARILENIHAVLKEGGCFRFLDWIDTPTNVAHPISLNYQDLSAELSKYYKQPLLKTNINENGAVGKIAYGVFYK